ncbi:MAG TPA: monovalent cation/H+ antiporter complex subunit F [Acidimicrobiales bacterium]|jgi:multicomponent Na+:H+ antiporter subunit F|nr:monovalent cation/H+ antiporter complex subunit F [Acidimicrobiales bacterium]
MTTVTTVAFATVAMSGLLCLLRLVRGPSLADRIVALDSMLIVIVSGIAVHAARTGDGTYLDVLVVASLLGFVGTVNVARFIERRGV